MALSFAERLAQVRAAQNPNLAAAIKATIDQDSGSDIKFGDITLNSTQALAPAKALSAESFVLTGAAGTGKTTTQSAVVAALESADRFGIHNFKYIGDAPSIAIVAFTKVAVRNMQKALKKNPVTTKYSRHCMTIHSLLEFQPEKVERYNSDGEPYETKMFVPKRNASNPLKITHLIVEEASMVGLPLWSQLYEALLPGVQVIFLGDINQVPPVFGRSIMSYALCRLPVIELTHVYRQALDNPIIANAHRVLRGEMVQAAADGRFNIVTGGNGYQVGQERMAQALTKDVFSKLHDLGDYDPVEDIILIPWGKGELGTKRMNERVATFLGAKRKALVVPVRAGFNTHYLAVGDKLLVDKRACWITKIAENPKYLGSKPPVPGSYSRDGTPLMLAVDIDWEAEGDASSVDDMPNYADFKMEDVEEEATKRAASHIVTVSYLAPNEEVDPDDVELDYELSTSGDFSEASFQFGYCMTFHKAQGSEWRKVYIILHKDFAGSLNREMIYTALTRAKEECTFISKLDTLERAIQIQSIKGTSLEEKVNYFNGGALTDLHSVPLIPGSEL